MTDRRAEIAERLTFLEQVASYFEHRDTRGEDQAHWANVYNAKNCREIAAELTRLTAEAEAQRAGVERLTRERDEALCLAEGPSTLLDLARGSLERGFEIASLTAALERMRTDRDELLDRLRQASPADVPIKYALAAAARTEH